jgi:hypothetical protein
MRLTLILLGAIGGTLLLAVAILSGINLECSQDRRSNEGQQTAQQDQQDANKAADPLVAAINRNETPSPAPNTQREKRDWWHPFVCEVKATDLAVAYFTLMLVIIGGIQARRLRQTVEATSTLASGAEDTAERQLRAYVGVRGGDIRYVLGGWRVWVDYINNGQTPAHDVKGSISVELLDIDPKRVFPPAEEWYGSWVIIPQAYATPDRIVAVSSAEDRAMQNGTSSKAVFVWGHIAYRDVFDGTTNVTFRYRVRFKLDRTGWYLHTEPEGNKTTYERKRTSGLSEP